MAKRRKTRAVNFGVILFCALSIGEAHLSAGAQAVVGADWQAEWEKTLAAAKKEGQVSVYSAYFERVFQEFRKEYPDIKVVLVTGSDLPTRILAERRGGKFLADVHNGGATAILNLLYKGNALGTIKDALILPEVVDESKWYGGQHRYADPDGKYLFVYLANPGSGQFSYNSDLVDPKELKSYWDLTRPKWKGKIVSMDPREGGMGGGMRFFYYQPELGPQFIKKFFGGMNLTFSKSILQMENWLAQGKYSVCLGCRNILRAKHQGLPVDQFEASTWKEGVYIASGVGTLTLLKQAPHSNAAKVLINWYLSRKGQMALQKLGEPDNPPNSRRIDIPKDDVPVANRPYEGTKYFDVVKPEFADMKPILDLVEETMRANELGR